jgi:cell division protein FtsB
MRSGDMALRLSVVVLVVTFIVMAAGLYEVDRREKSGSETAAANFTEMEQRVQILNSQIRILNDQSAKQLIASERLVQSLSSQMQALELRLKDLEDDLRVRRIGR